MDELAALADHRPDPLPPTPAERAAAEEQLMTHIAERTRPATAEGPPAAEGRPRRGRRVAMVGAAAAVALVALAVGVAGRGPEPLRARPTAAQQLEAIATVLQDADPYPTGPYAVTTRTITSTEGTPSPGDGTQEQTTYHVSATDTITDAGPCTGGVCFARIEASSPDPGFPLDGTAAQVRAGIEQRVEDFRGENDGPDATPWLTLDVVVRGLQHPAVGPEARAELLRMVVELADLSSEPGVTTSYGLVGTRFTAATPSGTIELVVDPADGYILEVRIHGEGQIQSQDEDGEWISETKILGSTRTFERPVATDPLPAAVADLAADVAAHHAAIEAAMPQGGCAGQSAGAGGEDWGVEIPDGLAFMHCWLP